MPCGSVLPAAYLEFGITNEEASLVTQSVSLTQKKDKKEARNGCGEVKAVTYYNETTEVSIEGLGANTGSNTVGTALSLAGSFGITVTGLIFVDEITVEKANEEFVKTSIKATAYRGITSST